MMQATRYVDWDGPVEIVVYMLGETRDNKGHDRDLEHVQWRWGVHAPNGIRRTGVESSKTHAMLEAEAAASMVRKQYAACLGVLTKEGQEA